MDVLVEVRQLMFLVCGCALGECSCFMCVVMVGELCDIWEVLQIVVELALSVVHQFELRFV